MVYATPEFVDFAPRILITPSLAQLRAWDAVYQASQSYDLDAHDRYWQHGAVID